MVQPALLEIPLLLGILSMSTALMGLSGHDLHTWDVLPKMIQEGPFPDFLILKDNGIRQVSLAVLIISAIAFAFSGFGLLQGCRQFKGRRGDYTGRGTGAFHLVGLGLLVLSGAFVGIASAYTAYSVNKNFSFAKGSGYSEPFTSKQQAYIQQIYNMISSGTTTSSLNVPDLSFIGVSLGSIGRWSGFTNITQVNDFLASERYLDYTIYKAIVIVSWFTLSVTFFVFMVHYIMPILLSHFNLLRKPKGNKLADY